MLPPSAVSNRRRPRTDHSRRSAQRESDARILRGAEILRAQLAQNNVQTEFHEHDVSWKSRVAIQKESARIRDDLLLLSASTSRGISPMRSDSPVATATKAKHVPEKSLRTSLLCGAATQLSEDEASFEDLWDSPTRPVKVKQKPVHETLVHKSDTLPSGTSDIFASRGDPLLWADLSSVAFTKSIDNVPSTDALSVTLPPCLSRLSGEPPPKTSVMGRNQTLKTKVSRNARNTVEPMDCSDDNAYSFVEDDYVDDDIEIALSSYDDGRVQTQAYLPKSSKSPGPTENFLMTSFNVSLDDEDDPAMDPAASRQFKPHVTPPRKSVPSHPKPSSKSPTSTIDLGPSRPLPTPLSFQFTQLLRDPAYLHAQKAGLLWQSLVGQHIRFPQHWWNGARSPPMGNELADSKWTFHGRTSIRGHRLLKQLVRNRASPGRLVLHIMVQDFMTRRPVLDICVGCLHSNARGIRTTPKAVMAMEDAREVWMAVRARSNANVSVLDPWLQNMPRTMSPLGDKVRVTNSNVRAVFGEKPPVETIFISENELYERLASQRGSCPAMDLLEEFVFS